MNAIKRFWKTKVRVLLPDLVKCLLSRVGNFIFPPDVYSTTNREEFLKKYHHFQRERSWTSPAQVWWRSQKVWKASTPLRYKELVSFIKQSFEPYLQKDFTACDLACACGDFAFIIAGKVSKIDAFDLSEGMIDTAIKRAKKRNISNVQFYQADATELVLEKEKYDAFMMLGLLTCIDDPFTDKIVKNVYQSMKAGAKLIVKDGITGKESTEYVYCHNNGYSAYYRTEINYVKLYERNGFKLIKLIKLGDSLCFAGIFERK